MTIPFDLMGVLLGLLILLAGLLAWRADKSEKSNFRLEDLVLDTKTGLASLSKVGQFIALSVSTWAFAYLTISGKLTEWFYTTYMMAWAGTSLAHKWIDQQEKK
jgi:hypothetical protein